VSAGCPSCARCAELNAEILRLLVRSVRRVQLAQEMPAAVRDELGVEWTERLHDAISVAVEELGGWDTAEPLIEARLDELKRMRYAAYLRSPEWADTRRTAVDHAGGRCQLCNKPGRLDVHHRTYERRGNERLSDLIALCRDCHTNFHASPGPDANHEAGARVLPLPNRKGRGMA
jgi:5-methylcytosine-specific restriction endonuclease McrA